ncbi:hypothetical protein RFI_02811, partial [Reticulomyxa filosa]
DLASFFSFEEIIKDVGSGGGIIELLIEQQLINHGSIQSNGGNGWGDVDGGGGSGGSILIELQCQSQSYSNKLKQTFGTITCIGGNQNKQYKGGKGRIAIYGSTNNFILLFFCFQIVFFFASFKLFFNLKNLLSIVTSDNIILLMNDVKNTSNFTRHLFYFYSVNVVTFFEYFSLFDHSLIFFYKVIIQYTIFELDQAKLFEEAGKKVNLYLYNFTLVRKICKERSEIIIVSISIFLIFFEILMQDLSKFTALPSYCGFYQKYFHTLYVYPFVFGRLEVSIILLSCIYVQI